MAISETLAHLTSSTKTLIVPKPFTSTSSTSRLTARWRIASNPQVPPPLSSTEIGTSAANDHRRRLVRSFDPTIPLPVAVTPPSSWYTDPSFLALEFDRVFFRGWQAVGFTEQIKNAHDFFTGRLGNVEFVICRDAQGELRAFHNVCRHHASLLICGSGQKSCFQCPYHGWTYGLDGVLLKATRITGIRNFNKDDFGLVPLKVATWEPFVLINIDQKILPPQNSTKQTVGNAWLGSASEILSTNGIDSSLKHVCRREYTIECNWKVFCDNYLDGGYHVPYAHGGLASGLKLDSYTIDIFEQVSIQWCESASTGEDDFDRLGSKALYAFVYPNFMVNRYGPWMDTNLVLPLSATKCQVIFDYFLDASLMDDEVFIQRSLEESERVQAEDIALCEGVQRGLESPAYCIGRYAPSVEKGNGSSSFKLCRYLRRRCSQDCVLSPYFPASNPHRFSCVHRIFGASNVTRMLQQLPDHQRAQAADAISSEAYWRVHNPVYGSVGIISQLQQDIYMHQRELALTQAQIAIRAAQQQYQYQCQAQAQAQHLDPLGMMEGGNIDDFSHLPFYF